ncbi:MAG: hypothetical protein KGZ39_02205 [Simkania sp.]|nr:hypothetical protein [Simkania sp.]
MSIKSERLRKLETELHDLEQWLKLGLVPKKDLQKHREEIHTLHSKIDEERERLRFLKESGDMDEAAAPKRPAHNRQQFQDPHSMADVDIVEEGLTDIGIDMESESFDFESSSGEENEEGDEEHATSAEEEEDEDPFSDRNRWKRGILEDPDAKDW